MNLYFVLSLRSLDLHLVLDGLEMVLDKEWNISYTVAVLVCPVSNWQIGFRKLPNWLSHDSSVIGHACIMAYEVLYLVMFSF